MSHWECGTQIGGEFAGRDYVKLLANGTDKTARLSLGNPHQRDPNDHYTKFYANPKDLYCLVSA